MTPSNEVLVSASPTLYLSSIFQKSRACALTVKLRGRTRRQAALKLNEAHRASPKRPAGRLGRTMFPAPEAPNKKPLTDPSNDC